MLLCNPIYSNILLIRDRNERVKFHECGSSRLLVLNFDRFINPKWFNMFPLELLWFIRFISHANVSGSELFSNMN